MAGARRGNETLWDFRLRMIRDCERIARVYEDKAAGIAPGATQERFLAKARAERVNAARQRELKTLTARDS